MDKRLLRHLISQLIVSPKAILVSEYFCAIALMKLIKGIRVSSLRFTDEFLILEIHRYYILLLRPEF